MKTTPDALKDLYEAFGGEASAVAEMDKTVDVLNAFAAKYEGKADAVVIPEAIENIVEVAGNIGGGGSEKITLIAQQSFTCDSYGEASVTAEGDLYLAGFDGKDATIVFDGVTFTAPMVYDATFTTLRIGEWADGWFDFEKVPVGFEIYADGAKAYTEGAGQHTAEVYVTEEAIVPTGVITITENGTHDVTEYAAAEVNVDKPSINLTVVNNLSAEIQIDGADDEGTKHTIAAGASKTFKCYGRTGFYGDEFYRLLYFYIVGVSDTSTIELKITGSNNPFPHFTNISYPSRFMTFLTNNPAQDATLNVNLING